MNYTDLSADQKRKISTLGELKSSGYQSKSIKDELRENLISAKKAGKNIFQGIWGYEDTVIPDVERAILSRHNINFLGLRGQAKTRMARMMTELLDEVVPVVKGAPLNDDPLNPISKFAVDQIKELILKAASSSGSALICRSMVSIITYSIDSFTVGTIVSTVSKREISINFLVAG